MWLSLSNAFFSIVASPTDPDLLVVRARRAGDLERVFEGAVSTHTPHRDYAYRSHLPRDVVAAAVMCQVLGINYGNFKDSVKDRDLHSAYSRVWGVMAGVQKRSPWSGAAPRARTGRGAKAAQRALFRKPPQDVDFVDAGDHGSYGGLAYAE